MSSKRDDPLAGRIFIVRGRRVVLDEDLARIYGTTTKAFNQAVRRNRARFPADFAYQLSDSEHAAVNSQVAEQKKDAPMWSQIVTTSKPSADA